MANCITQNVIHGASKQLGIHGERQVLIFVITQLAFAGFGFNPRFFH